MKLNIVILGLSITSSWGNGHASTYRALIKALAGRGHDITFLERDVPWYRQHRDVHDLPYCRIEFYDALKDVARRFGTLIKTADLVVLGSYVPDGAILGDWITSAARGVTAFYDIDTPVTLRQLESRQCDYMTAALIPRFDLYLSFTGGPTLQLIQEVYGSPRARALYCGVDPQQHAQLKSPVKWALGYLGTFSEDRQPLLECLLIEPARRRPRDRFVVAGAQYPDSICWPDNVERIEHLAPGSHWEFYCRQRYTLNITRADMALAGFSPSVRLFEAAACGVPIISDPWPGIETILQPGKQILLAQTTDEIVRILEEVPETMRRQLGAAAHQHVLRHHTADDRAGQLEQYYREAVGRPLAKAQTEAIA